MALSVTTNRTDTVGRYTKYTTGTVTFDSSYATGGEALLPTALGLSSKIEFVSFSPASGYVFEYDYTNSKVKAYNTTKGGSIPSGGAAGVEVASTTDLSAVTCQYIAFGN